MEKIKDVITLALIYIFFRVKWIDGIDAGYYLMKRKWVWFLLLPLMLIPVIVQAVYEHIVVIFSYDLQWIPSSEPKKLTFGEKLLIGYKLLK